MAKEVDTKGYVKMYRKAQEDEVFKILMHGSYIRTASSMPLSIVDMARLVR